jgi:hypothetical protein
MAPDLANPGHTTTALPLNELQARVYQPAPVGLVPANDPMVLKNNQINLEKLNAYRAGVDQPPVMNVNQASPKRYCENLEDVGAPRIVRDASFTSRFTSPDAAVGNTLFTFLAQRFVNTYTNLNCQGFLGEPSPITTKLNGNGVASEVFFAGRPVRTRQGQ